MLLNALLGLACTSLQRLIARVEGMGSHGAGGVGQRTLHVRLGTGQEVVKVKLTSLDLKVEKRNRTEAL